MMPAIYLTLYLVISGGGGMHMRHIYKVSGIKGKGIFIHASLKLNQSRKSE
jgi:hypothetical protein